MDVFVSSNVLPSFLPPKKTGPPQFHGTSCQSPLGLLHHLCDFVGPFASAELLPGGFLLVQVMGPEPIIVNGVIVYR